MKNTRLPAARRTKRGTAGQDAPAGMVPAKWRWHYRVLRALQEQLLRERGESLRAAAEPLEPHSLDEADSATDEFDHALGLTRLSAEQDALYEVNEALRRIAAGAYGVCLETGKPIPDARLKAVPWTRFTRPIEERLEKEGHLRGPQLRRAGHSLRRGAGRVLPSMTLLPAVDNYDATDGTAQREHALT